MTKHEAVFTKDIENKKLTVVRPFDAPLESVWKAWTVGEILDQWWAPRPYRAQTKSMNFEEGGQWNYLMIGPSGDQTWCRVTYTAIDQLRSITSYAMFCDDAGNENPDFPRMYWTQEFAHTNNGTTVTIYITFDKTADMEKIIGMGFSEGFTAGLNNLEEYLGDK